MSLSLTALSVVVYQMACTLFWLVLGLFLGVTS